MIFPDFNVPTSPSERERWAKQILDAAAYRAHNLGVSQRKQKYRKNFLRYIGELDIWEGSYMMNTFGLAKPALYANYPLIEPLINRLVGQYSSVKTVFSVSKINENANSEKLDMMANVLVEDMLKPYWANLEKKTGVKFDFEERGKLLPEDKKKYFMYNYRDMEEESIFYSLDYIMNIFRVGDEYGLMLYDMLINDDCFGKIDFVDNNPVPRRINPECMIFPEPPESYIWYDSSKWDYAGEDMRLSYDEVLKRFGPLMKPKDLIKLRDNVKNYRMGALEGWLNGIQYYWTEGRDVWMRVVPFQWKAENKEGIKVNPKDYPFSDVLSAEIPRSEVWKGFKIGHDIYSYGKKPNQIPNKDNLRDMQLDYFGMMTRHSFMRKAWAIQNLYNAANIAREFLTNQAGGKGVILKSSKFPDGVKAPQMNFNARVMGFIEEEDKEGEVNSGSVLRGQYDLGISDSVNTLNNLIHSLEISAERMVGVTEGMLGQSPGSTPVGTLNLNTTNASFIVQPIFDSLSRIKEMSLQRVSDLVKYLWAEDETKSYFLGDGGLMPFKLYPSNCNYDYGIYVQDSMKELQKKKQYMEMGAKVLATDATLILELIKMSNADSSIEVEKILENGINIIRKTTEEMNKAKIAADNNRTKVMAEGNKLMQQKMMLDAKVPVDVANVNKERGIHEALIGKEGKENVARIMAGNVLDKQQLADHNMLQQSTNTDNVENSPMES